METKPMASNESVAAELRGLIGKWRKLQQAALDDIEAEKAGTQEPGAVDSFATFYMAKKCADELEPLIARLAAHTDSCTGTASGVPKTENVSGTADVEMDDAVSPRWSVGSG